MVRPIIEYLDYAVAADAFIICTFVILVCLCIVEGPMRFPGLPHFHSDFIQRNPVCF